MSLWGVEEPRNYRLQKSLKDEGFNLRCRNEKNRQCSCFLLNFLLFSTPCLSLLFYEKHLCGADCLTCHLCHTLLTFYVPFFLKRTSKYHNRYYTSNKFLLACLHLRQHLRKTLAKGRAQAREQPFKATELPRANICANKQHLLPFTFFDLRASHVLGKFSMSD